MEAVEAPADWKTLGLSEPLLELLQKAGFVAPTPIQVQAIPLALNGRDLIASAKTGSGKTASFVLPMVERMKGGRMGTYGLILCPTREIAIQSAEVLKTFGEPLGVKNAVLIGGNTYDGDLEALRSGPHVIVGTPGRIVDQLGRGNLWLEYLEMVVLDEADRMLDMGFSAELDKIRAELSPSVQTLLFSATMPAKIERLAQKMLSKPERISIGSALSVSNTIDHRLLWVNEKSKKRELMRLLERDREGTAIIFVRTKDGCTDLWRRIHAAGLHESTYISSNKIQAHREEALNGFKSGKYRVLVATDVAGRGIHVDDVKWVVNYDIPEEPEDYIHRVGRTGRQETQGRAMSFATPSDGTRIEAIERVLGKKIDEGLAEDWDPEVERSSRGGRRFSGGGRGGGGGRGRSTSRRRSSGSSGSGSRSGGGQKKSSGGGGRGRRRRSGGGRGRSSGNSKPSGNSNS